MPRFRSAKILADIKQETVRHYNCLTRIHAEPFIPSEEILETTENFPQALNFISDNISIFSIACLEDLLGNNKKVSDLYKELKSLYTHFCKVKECAPKGTHPAILGYFLLFDRVPDLRKQLQRETGYDPHDKDWHIKISSTPLYNAALKAYLQKGNDPAVDSQEEEYSLPYFMEPLNLGQERKEFFLRLWKFVCSPELDFEHRFYACLIFELDKELGKRYNKELVDEYMAEFCLDKKKSRKARAYRCKNRNEHSQEPDSNKLLGKDPEFEERVRKLL